jgi:FKBP-type peptidyl-prolyl cis-trans isomerase
MKVGETSSFTLLPSYAYGEAGSPPEILPSSTIIFDISLIAINGVTLSDATKNPNPSSITVDPVMERLAKVRLDREKNELKRQIEKKATEIKKQMAKEKLAKKSAGSKKKKKKI